MRSPRTARQGFTLVELSIVLVIIGLVIGGVVVGQDLIRAAQVNAQIAQIAKYNSAVNTFRGKYGYLPGDIPEPAATSFGFIPRTGFSDGNGIIQSWGSGWHQLGETTLFWNDLGVAGLIDGTFPSVTTTPTSNPSGAALDGWYPKAKIGGGNYVYVESGGWSEAWISGAPTGGDGHNYFAISAVQSINFSGYYELLSNSGLTVQQAFMIDSKIDDGLPQSGSVLAAYQNWGWLWARYNAEPSGTPGDNQEGAYQWGNPTGVSPTQTPTSGDTTTCYDNGNSWGTQHYSTEIGGGANINCGLSFRFN